MKNTKKLHFFIIFAMIIFIVVACSNPAGGGGGGGGSNGSNGNGTTPTLPGNISISPSANVVTGMELTATYTGTETVSYQWRRETANVGTNSDKFTPSEVGSYTVTVSADGFSSKTSTAVTVTAIPNLSGNISISPSIGVTIGTELTATYTGVENVTYQWIRGTTNVGINSDKFTPLEAGSYTVTVSADGFNSKTSDAVVVIIPTYTITFNANIAGYGGTMTDQTHTVGQSQNLSVNGFVREGFTFLGWSSTVQPFGALPQYTDGQSVSNITTTAGATVDLYAIWDFAFAIGAEGPGTGIIYYVADGQDGRSLGFPVEGYTGTIAGVNRSFEAYTAYYLEVAPSDPGNAEWGNHGVAISGLTPGFPFVTDPVDGGVFPDATRIGNGRKDTLTIIAHLAANTNETGRAAQVAAASMDGNRNDWFLPSFGELSLLFEQKDLPGIGIITGTLWTTSQFTGQFAWFKNFATGSEGYNLKDISRLVYAIRAF